MTADAPQRRDDRREVSNGLRWSVRTSSAWRYPPGDLPPWAAVHQHTQRWIAAGRFDDMVHDLRALLREAAGRADDPSAVLLDARTVQRTPERGGRAGDDGHKRRKGSKTHAAGDTLGQLLARHVTPANDQERE